MNNWSITNIILMVFVFSVVVGFFATYIIKHEKHHEHKNTTSTQIGESP